jgi:uncharacterized Fe-S cluster-containing radical SAM superfamily protein
MNKNYCALIYKSLYVEKTADSRVRVGSCCINKKHTAIGVDFDNDPILQQQRKEIKEDKQIINCEECWNRGNHSLRQVSNDLFASQGLLKDPYRPELVKLEYNVEPYCNAKCIMCGPWFSSTWAQEQHQFDGSPPPRPMREFKHNDSLRDVEFDSLQKIYFNGGEPLLTKEHITVLERIPDLSKVEVTYNTNGSMFPDTSVLRLWEKAKSITLNVSVDATGKEFEYIRNPLKWDVVEYNVRQFVDHRWNVGISFTAGIYNLFEINKTRSWFREFSNGEFYIHPVDINDQYSITKADRETKQRFVDYINDAEWGQELLDQLNDHWDLRNDDWKKSLDKLDQRRGTDWHAVFNQLA